MEEMTYQKVKNFIEKYGMIKEGSLIVAGVSGGADSVCLLHMLYRLTKEISFRLVVVHVDHGVRPDAAEDAAYVEGLCKERGIFFLLKKVDMNGYAKAHGMSCEEAGRALRYEAFAEAVKKQGQGFSDCRIAVAHNANDRAETMLFHLFRGSGVKGLCSIQPVRDSVIRPLLCLERSEIEDYLAKWRVDYCLDSTNEEDGYTRNRIRHHVLSYAEQEICSGAVFHMCGLADILSETERYLEGQAARLYEICVEEIFEKKQKAAVYSVSPEGTEGQAQRKDGPWCLSVQNAYLASEDSVIRDRVLLQCMERITPHRKDITARHMTALRELLEKEGSKELSLPCGVKAYKEYDRLFIYREEDWNGFPEKERVEADEVYAVRPPAELSVPGEGIYVFTLLERENVFSEKQQNIPQNRYTKWFDYDKITTTLLLRTRRQGDYLTIDDALHTKSVKQYMINEKIPRMQRDSMHILADGAHILWVPGYRISTRYRVDESTRRILQVRLRGGNHGGTSRSIIDRGRSE